MTAGDPRVGSATEEAGRLLEAVEHWARHRLGSLGDTEHLSTGAPECTVCPVCQGIGLLRQVPPEAVGHLLDAAGSLVAALKAAVPVPAPETRGSGAPAPGVQHIVLDDGPEPW